MVFKKMLDSKEQGDKGEYEECIDAAVLARNVLLRTHGFSPYQHVFGRDSELSFDVLVPEADVAAVTMLVLDRLSERAVQIRQAARKAFVESQDDKAMRRSLVARPRPWREFKVGDPVAFWRKGKGREMRSGHARWHGRAMCWLCVLDQRMCGWLTGINCPRCRKNSCGWQQSRRGLQMI